MKTYIGIFLLVFLSACSGSKNNEQAEQPLPGNVVKLTGEQLRNAGIVTAKAEQRNIASELRITGMIDVPPQNKVSISVPLGGYLKSTQLLPGMHITKGQSIAVMEDQQYIQLQQDYLTTQAKFNYAESEYNRQKDLNLSKAASDKTLQQAEADYKTEKIALKSLSEKLQLIGINPDKLSDNSISRQISISSPIDGYVSAVNVNIGKYVSPTDVLFEIVDPTDIHLALHVFEKDIDKIKIGQKLKAFTNNDPSKKYICEIILIGRDVSPDKSVEVHCHFEQYDQQLIPGLFMNADIETENASTWTLPDEAIVSSEGKRYVFFETGNNTFEMLQIQPGKSENGFTQITFDDPAKRSALSFVTKGAYTLLMKLKNTSDE